MHSCVLTNVFVSLFIYGSPLALNPGLSTLNCMCEDVFTELLSFFLQKKLYH